MALRKLTIEWQGGPNTEGALDWANKTEYLRSQREALRKVLLNGEEHPENLTDSRFEAVGGMRNTGGDHIPGSTNRCYAEIVCEGSLLRSSTFEKLGPLLLSVFPEEGLQLKVNDINPGERGYEDLFTN